MSETRFNTSHRDGTCNCHLTIIWDETGRFSECAICGETDEHCPCGEIHETDLYRYLKMTHDERVTAGIAELREGVDF